MTTFLAELPESRATGDTKKIYDDMKCLGVPMLSLIFRHLATLPGALEWAWDAIGPAWANTGSYSRRLGGSHARPRWSRSPRCRGRHTALGVDDVGLREIHVVVDSYNLANPVNLLSVTCLARLVDGGKASRPIEARRWNPPPGPEGGARLVPSLYRHFGHRLGFLALVVTLILPRLQDGSIPCSVRAIRAEMDQAAAELARGISAPPAPDPGIAVAFERFGTMIPQMIVVGALLKRALLD